MTPVTTKGRANLFSLSFLSAVSHDLAVLIMKFLTVWTTDPLGPVELEGLEGSGFSVDSVAGGVGTIGGGHFGGGIAAGKTLILIISEQWSGMYVAYLLHQRR